ncbi:MAG: tetratricopeptide repeat protein [Bradymonadia bacterium]
MTMRAMFGRMAVLVFLVTAGCNYAEVESNTLVEKGMKLYASKSIDKAMAEFQKAAQVFPNNARALYGMALVDMDYHDYKQAMIHLQGAAGLDPQDPVYPFTLGMAHRGQADKLYESNDIDGSIGEYAACAHSMEQAAKLDPYDPAVHLEMARCDVRAERYGDAVDAYQDAIKADPFFRSSFGTTEHYKELGELYAHFGFYDQALRILRNGILNNTGDSVLEMTLADILMEQGEYLEAAAHYEQASKTVDLREESKLRALPAYLGAGKAFYALARHSQREGQHKLARDQYIAARDWLMQYIESAITEELKLHRATAVQHVKEIEDLLSEYSETI